MFKFWEVVCRMAPLCDCMARAPGPKFNAWGNIRFGKWCANWLLYKRTLAKE